MRLEFSPEALDDLHKIREYTLKTWGETQAEHYLDMLQRACEMLVEIPNIGQELPEIQRHLHMISSGSHFIFYLAQTRQLLVVAIYHKRMDALSRLVGRLQ